MSYRSRIYALVRSDELQATNDPVAGLRIAAAVIARRHGLGEIVGSPLSAANAWFLIALASGDPLFEAHVSGLVRPAMLPHVRARLDQEGLLANRHAARRQQPVDEEPPAVQARPAPGHGKAQR